MKRILLLQILILFVILVSSVFGIEMVSESPKPCEKVVAPKKVGLKFFKDPNLWSWEESVGSPLLTTLSGEIEIERLSQPFPLKHIKELSRLFDHPNLLGSSQDIKPSNSPIPQVIYIKICSGVYQDSVGFILEENLNLSQTETLNESGNMPPSTLGNPIPRLKKDS